MATTSAMASNDQGGASDSKTPPSSEPSSDLARRFQSAEARGETADALQLAPQDVPVQVQQRVEKAGVQFQQLSGLLQRALLWDSGFVFEYGTKRPLVKVSVKCGLGMGDIAVSLDAFRSVGCTEQQCNSSYRSLYCTGTQMANASLCTVAPNVVQSMSASMWATEGAPNSIPVPGISKHAWNDRGESYLMFAIHTALHEVPYGKCPSENGASSAIIPCAPMQDPQASSWCDPRPSAYIDQWLQTAALQGNHNSTKSDASLKAGYIALIVIGVVLLLAATAFLIQRRRRSSKANDHQDVSVIVGENQPLSPLMPSYAPLNEAHSSTAAGDKRDGLREQASTLLVEELQDFELALLQDSALRGKRLPFDELTVTSTLARKASYTLSLGEYRERSVVIKRIVPRKGDLQRPLQRFVTEIHLTATLDHQCIVQFIGVTWSTAETLSMVTEHMDYGSIQSYLSTHDKEGRLTWSERKLAWAIATAEALAYLHQQTPVVRYRDVKAQNVLLDDMLRAKLVDCGLDRDHFDQDQMATVGKPFWTPPEVLTGSRHTTAGDVYAFGVFLSEVDTCQMPYLSKSSSKEPMTRSLLLQAIVAGDLRPSFTQSCPTYLKDLAMQCLHSKPEMRPTAAALVQVLEREKPVYEL